MIDNCMTVANVVLFIFVLITSNCYSTSEVTVNAFKPAVVLGRGVHRHCNPSRHRLRDQPSNMLLLHRTNLMMIRRSADVLNKISYSRREFVKTSTAAATTTTAMALSSPSSSGGGGGIGPTLDSSDVIQNALKSNRQTVIIDVRGLDEIQSNGVFNPTSAIINQLRWMSAPCTLQDGCPLLESCSDVMLRDKTSPIVIYCASGKRADKAKQLLIDKGYQYVYNAGAYPTDTKQYD
jgi:rhodanese-related sulfurtransferase